MLIANPTFGIVITEVDVQQHEPTVCLHAKNNNDDTFFVANTTKMYYPNSSHIDK